MLPLCLSLTSDLYWRRTRPSMSALEHTSARVVCRECGGLDALDHVVSTISEMLDASRPWTLEDAAVRGYARLVTRLLWTQYGDAPLRAVDKAFDSALRTAASLGYLETVKSMVAWLPPNGRVASAMEEAAGNGHMEVLVWLQENVPGAATQRMTLDAMDSAAVNGHVEVLRWMQNNRPEGCTTRAMDAAARAGRLDIVRWLHKNRREGCTTQAMDGAAANGHLHVLEWLHHHRQEGCSSLAMVVARMNGHVHVVEWLEQKLSDERKPLVTWHEKNFRALHRRVQVAMPCKM